MNKCDNGILSNEKEGRICPGRHKEKAEELIRRICNERGINIKKLQPGSRRGQIPGVRSHIACERVELYGLPLAEIARRLGVSMSAVCKILKRTAHTS